MKLIITFLVSLNVSLSYCRGGLFTTAAAVFNIHMNQLYTICIVWLIKYLQFPIHNCNG